MAKDGMGHACHLKRKGRNKILVLEMVLGGREGRGSEKIGNSIQYLADAFILFKCTETTFLFLIKSSILKKSQGDLLLRQYSHETTNSKNTSIIHCPGICKHDLETLVIALSETSYKTAT